MIRNIVLVSFLILITSGLLAQRKFQPTLGFGFGFEKVKWYTYFLTSANVGFKYKMDDFCVSTILNTDIRVSRSPVFPVSSWFSYYLNVGLGYRF